MKNKILTIFSLVLLLTGVMATSAKADNDKNKLNENKINQNSKTKEIKYPRFEIKGVVTNVSDTAFEINGLTITIDKTKVKEFEQEGILQEGKLAEIKGITIDSTNYATQIEVKNEKDGDNDIENDNDEDDNLLTSPTPSVNPSVSPNPTPTASASPLISPIPSESPKVSPTPSSSALLLKSQLSPTQIGWLNQILELLRQLLSKKS